MDKPKKYVLPHTELSKLLSPEANVRVHRLLAKYILKYQDQILERRKMKINTNDKTETE
jgi:hypothetical protein